MYHGEHIAIAGNWLIFANTIWPKGEMTVIVSRDIVGEKKQGIIWTVLVMAKTQT